MAKKLLRAPAGLLIDLSGTIHIEDSAIPGAIDAIKRLNTKEIPYLFVTNTTKVRLHKAFQDLSF